MIMKVLLMVVILVLLSKEASLALGDISTATSYGPPYLPTRCNGDRQDQFPAGNLFVAVSEGLWDNGAACGRRYRLRCLNGIGKPCKENNIVVEVVDLCSNPCPSTLRLSKDAFSAVSRFPNAKIIVEYIQV